ncbi:MAG: shikimate dehydrogenase [Parcubacteria group bacterium Gr01-1014_8]|nr:MAG: shikimate dehydrogenase [Parcubacteria group bacterium Gr01-1014_8]
MTETKKRTAVVGHPIAHSLSPLLHNAIYERERIDAEMFRYDETDIVSFVSTVREEPLHLVAVTLPHKQSVIPLLDEVDHVASEIGSVNTIINREGMLKGSNTDFLGIATSLEDLPLEHKNVLVLGAGGAAQPVAYYLRQQKADLYCFNRDVEKARELCERFGGTPVVNIDDVKNVEFRLIINATPLGLNSSDTLPIPEEFLHPGMTVFDLIYTPTKLQDIAKRKGANVISGLGMFVAQGLEQEKRWLGREIVDPGYTALLRAELEKNNALN